LLKLRRGKVVNADPLLVEVSGEHRPAWADEELVGRPAMGDEVIVNIEAAELGLGSGGFDLIHANLTRGLAEEADDTARIMKLNYTSLQHGVGTVETPDAELTRRPPVLVLMLHGQVAPAAWAFGAAAKGMKLGYLQTVGGALPGRLSTTVAELTARGLLTGHVTAGPSYGGQHEAISVAGGLHAAASRLGWDAVVAGPGPGIIGSDTTYGHGGMAALDTAHAALGLGLPTLLAPRMSRADPRDRHRGASHHTLAVLGLLLRPVRLPVSGQEGGLAELRRAAESGGHELVDQPADLEGYRASGLPAVTMGRELSQDPDFFSPALAAGAALAEAAAGRK
jgi:hypothetical protein